MRWRGQDALGWWGTPGWLGTLDWLGMLCQLNLLFVDSSILGERCDSFTDWRLD